MRPWPSSWSPSPTASSSAAATPVLGTGSAQSSPTNDASKIGSTGPAKDPAGLAAGLGMAFVSQNKESSVMTDTAVQAAHSPGAFPAHPLDPASAAEYLAGRDIMAAAGLLAEPVRFAYYGLEEPPKDQLLGTPDGGGRPPDRRLRAFLINVAT